VVLLPSAIWRELLRVRQGAGLDAPVFHPTAAVVICTRGRSSVWSRKPPARRPGTGRLTPLAAPQPRDPCGRARCADLPGAGHGVGGYDGALFACAADEQFIAVSRGLITMSRLYPDCIASACV
jgi:hypothetical protein